MGQIIASRIKYKIKELDVVSGGAAGILAVRKWKREIRKLIKRMTSHQPKDRPSAIEVLTAFGEVIISDNDIK